MIDREKFDQVMRETAEKLTKLNDGKPVGVSVVTIWLDENSSFSGGTSTYANFSMTPELMSPVFDSLLRSTVDANVRYFVQSQGGQVGTSH